MLFQRRLITIFFVVFCLSFANSPNFIRGEIDGRMDRTSYAAGDTAIMKVGIMNKDSVPVVDGYLTFMLTRGNDTPVYPNYIIDENVITEKIVYEINIRPIDTIEVETTFEIPANIPPGEYRMDTFFTTPRNPVSGLPFIYFTPKPMMTRCGEITICPTFNITNDGSWKDLRIDRESMLVAGMPGQTGRVDRMPEEGKTVMPLVVLRESGLDPRTWAWGIGNVFGVNEWRFTPKVGTEQPVSFMLENRGPTDCTNVSVTVEAHTWDDTKPESGLTPEIHSRPKTNTTYYLGPIKVGENVWANSTFMLPDLSTAYSILITVKDENEILSIYRSRVDVWGAGSRITSIKPTNYRYESGDVVNITTMILAASDGVNKGEHLFLSIEINDPKGKVGYIVHPEMTITADEAFTLETTSIPAPRRLRNFTIHANLRSGPKTIDDVYIHIDKDKFPAKLVSVNVTTIKNGKMTRDFMPGDKMRVNIELIDEDGDPKAGTIDAKLIFSSETDDEQEEELIAFGRKIDGTFTSNLLVPPSWLGKQITLFVKERETKLSGHTSIFMSEWKPPPKPSEDEDDENETIGPTVEIVPSLPTNPKVYYFFGGAAILGGILFIVLFALPPKKKVIKGVE